MKNYILFDHDGVLVDTERFFYLATCRALKEIGIEISLDTYLENMSNGISSWELAKVAGVNQRTILASREARNEYYRDYLTSENIEINGVTETLEELASSYKLAIVTTSRRVDFDLIHKNRNIVGYMDFVLTVEDYSHAKPHPEPYLAALRRFGALASEAVVIEDSARGLRSAVAAEIDCIVVKNKFTAGQNFAGAILKIDNISALPNAIGEL